MDGNIKNKITSNHMHRPWVKPCSKIRKNRNLVCVVVPPTVGYLDSSPSANKFATDIHVDPDLTYPAKGLTTILYDHDPIVCEFMRYYDPLPRMLEFCAKCPPEHVRNLCKVSPLNVNIWYLGKLPHFDYD